MVSVVFLVGFSACFTGIESTKKISLSRDDKKKAAITPEQKFFSGITPPILKDWEPGKKFVVHDNKALLVFESIIPFIFNDSISFEGKIIEFVGVNSKMGPDGNLNLALSFTDGIHEFIYNTSKSFDEAMEKFTSADLPMLIDLSMVEQADEILKGKVVWTRSNLWYDSKDNRIDGKKFIPVTISEVFPGNAIFPLKLQLTEENSSPFYMFMNFGIADNESRAFHNLFSLSDIRKSYPSILPETWDLISAGKITEGMTKQECRLALGNPIDIKSGHDYSQTLDIWAYDNGFILWFEDGKLVRHKGY